jgi:uncharacterized protein (DUF1330 family)
MSVYVVGLVTITDRGKYAAYEERFRAVLTPFGGEILAVEDAARIVEGSWPAQRTVILRFPSEEAAKQWYDSEPYQELVRLRAGAAEAAIAILTAR